MAFMILRFDAGPDEVYARDAFREVVGRPVKLTGPAGQEVTATLSNATVAADGSHVLMTFSLPDGPEPEPPGT